MSVETATYINDLQPVNPPSTDPRSQGDDHLRLVKQVLQNQFPGASRPRPIENVVAINGPSTTSVLKGNDQASFYIATTGGVATLNLPTLVAGDAGWCIFVYKYTSDVNAIFIVPPSGTLFSGALSLAKARRCIPGITFKIVWNGGFFFVERCCVLPIGSMVDYAGATLPAGFEWPNGQTLSSAAANYPEYNAVIGSGVTLDLRGRYIATLDNLGGSAASRITTAGGGVDGATLAAVGGVQNVTLITANLPAYTPTGAVASTVSFGGDTNAGSLIKPPVGGGNVGLGGSATGGSETSILNGNLFVTSTFTGTAQGGLSTAVKILPPTIMLSKILVVE